MKTQSKYFKYNHSPRGRLVRRKYAQSEKGKLARKKYAQSEKGKLAARKGVKKYYQTKEGKRLHKILHKKYRQSEKGKVTYRRLRKEYLKRLRFEVLIYYGGDPPKCACCGEAFEEFLGIDHIKGGGNQHRKNLKGVSVYQDLRNRKFPTGYRVLCYNCNLSIGFRGYCPHQEKINKQNN